MTRRLLALALAGPALALAGCRAAPAPPAWASVVVAGTGRDGAVLRFYDPVALRPAGELAVAGTLVAVEPNPALPQLEVLTSRPDALLEVGAADRRVQAAIPLPASPHALAFSRDGKRVVVSAGNGLLAIDLATRATVSRAVVGAQLTNLAFTPDDTRLVGADAAGKALVWLDPDRLTRTASTPLAAAPVELLLLGYGRKAFALCPDRNQLAVVDTVSGQLLTYLPVGPQPAAMLFKPDGGELYVANRGGGTVSIVDTGTNEVSGTMWAGQGPAALAVSGDGSILYVANADAGTVAGLSTEDRRPLIAINVGQRPVALAVGPRAQYVFAADAASSDVAVLHADLANADHRYLVNLLPAPRAPDRIAVLQ